MKRTLLFLGIFALFLTACADQAVPTPTPTVPTITINVTPSAQPVIPAINRCVSEIGGLNANIEERYAEYASSDLLIRLGEPEQFSSWAAQIGQEELIVVLNPSNPVGSLTPDEIQALFSGQTTNWNALGGADMPVNVWVPLDGDEARSAFDQQIMQGLPPVSSAKLAPEPDAMQQAISTDPYAVGFLAQANLADSYGLRVILPGVRLPLLVLADRAPEGPAAELVNCLQNGVGQETLTEVYP